MPWFYVDDGFSDSKPVLNMPDRHRLAACGLWVLAGSWSAKEELDGFVPNSKLRQLGARLPILSVLTDPGPMSAPLCERVSRGIQFNSWDKWQPTKAELEAERIENDRKREADAERKRRERAEQNDETPQRTRRRRKGRNAVTSGNNPRSASGDPNASELSPDGRPDGQGSDSRAGAGGRLDPTRPDPTLLSTSGCVPEEPHVSRPPGRSRGTRLPADWMPAPDVIAQMRDAHPHIDLEAEHRKFIDYWTDKTGKDATKQSWTGTWRNWIRRASEHQPARAAPHVNGQAQPTAFERKKAANGAVFHSLANERPPELMP